MPPSMESVNPSSLSNKIDSKNPSVGKHRMTMNGYNLMNLGKEKAPVLPGWQERTSEVLAKAFTENDRISIRLGRQLNGRYVVSLDFDCYSAKGENPITKTACDEYLERIDRKDGMYSSSTFGNYNVLVDVTDVPEILEMCESYPKNHWDSDHIQFLVQQTAQQVIPPTRTGNKRTYDEEHKTMVPGKPRKFLNDVPFYKMTPNDEYMIQFFHKHYVPDTPKPKDTKPKPKPVRTVVEVVEVEDEWTELLFTVIKNDANGKDYVITYNQWQGIGTILNHNNYPIDVFKKWHLMCPLNSDDGSAERYWESIKGTGFSIYALQGIAKKVNPPLYKLWFVKHKKFLSLKILGQGENDVAQYMAPIMKEHLVWTGKLWYRNDRRLWLPSKEAPVATIANQLQKIIDLSRETLMAKMNDTDDEDEKKRMEKMVGAYSHHRLLCQGSTFTGHIAKMFKEYLFDERFEDKINQTQYKMVYQDGIYDMRTKSFRKGIFPYEYITKTLPFDYEKGDEEVKRQILKSIKRICNNKQNQLEYYLSTFGYALTGDASREQIMWYMCGEGACNGKSSVLEALTTILPIYVKGESRDNFYKNDTKLHKAIGTWANMRILWVNELEDKKKVNEALFKAVCDGTSVPFSKHYGENEIMPISFKLFLVSNFQFNIDMDEGVKRRFKHEQFNAKFNLDRAEPEDEDKCLFWGNPEFAKWLADHKHSLLEIIYEYSHQYAVKGLPPCPPEWEEKKKETVANCNEFGTNLRALCVVGESFSAWNDDLLNALEVKDSSAIKSEMKRMGLFHKYDSQFKKSGKKGLHTGLRLKTQEELDADQKRREAQMENVVIAGAGMADAGYQDIDTEYH